MSDILYPYALDEQNKLVSVKDGVPGRYHCVECEYEMIPRRGEINQWHFAHKSDNPSCSGESALHKIAKMVLVEKFNGGNLPSMWLSCPSCGKGYFNNVDREWEIDTEKTWDSIRPDVSFWKGGKLQFVIEVIVSHKLDGPTARKYEEYEVPVFLRRPSWDLLSNYFETLNGEMLSYYDHKRCFDYTNVYHICFYYQKISPSWRLIEHCRPCYFYKDGDCTTRGATELGRRNASL